MILFCGLGQKYINEDKAKYFNALKQENRNCEQFPAFNDEQTEMEVSMDIEEAQQSDDECFGEEYVSQRQAEMDFKLEKALQRERKLKNEVSR